ncbi:MAG: gamma-glutamylcyclotransferase [Proteobacteria bacterium]|nr:gamma-glutamylcyclotransferase [Pseudomonadota bacterium]
MRFFFYGTLLDRDVTAIVLGRRLPPQAFISATLHGHTRYRARGVTYPIIVRDPNGQVQGAIVQGLSALDVARLAAYEGPRYRIAPLTVEIHAALTTVSVFEPLEKRFEPVDGAWDLALWQRRHKRAFVDRIRRAFSAHPAYSRR